MTMAYKFVLKKILNGTPDENDQTLGEYLFKDSIFTVGSEDGNNLVIANAAHEQAVIINEGDHLKLINSAEGTSLNERYLRREAMEILKHGDEIRIIDRVLLIVDESKISIPNNKPADSPPPIPMPKPETFIEISPIEDFITKQVSKPTKPKSSANFSDILDTLRTEEDSFYFIVKRAEKEIGRVPIKHAKTLIGKNAKGIISFNSKKIITVFCIAHKDWGGILIEPKKPNSVMVNGEVLEDNRRLRNNDSVTFKSAPKGFSLTLHEPSLLVALEPLLKNDSATNSLLNAESAAIGEPISESKKDSPVIEKRYFGYFSFLEVLTMVIGTLICAVIFFLLFEFIFSQI